jgi:cytochrome c oxidase subunit 3
LSNSPVAAEHSENLQHHFVNLEQQREAVSLGMWLFLATEIMFFGGMFCAYLIYRLWYFNEFAAGSRSLNVTLGAVNTAVLICSSLTVAMGVRAAQMGKRRLLVILLLLTIVFGFAFLGIKGVEWYDKYKEHHIPGATFNADDLARDNPQIPIDQHHEQIYFSLYFAMTGLHALHMIIGIGLFAFLTYYAMRGKYTPDYYNPVEMGGLYWHFVDIVWIYLFPLLYLIDLKK